MKLFFFIIIYKFLKKWDFGKSFVVFYLLREKKKQIFFFNQDVLHMEVIVL